MQRFGWQALALGTFQFHHFPARCALFPLALSPAGHLSPGEPVLAVAGTGITLAGTGVTLAGTGITLLISFLYLCAPGWSSAGLRVLPASLCEDFEVGTLNLGFILLSWGGEML